MAADPRCDFTRRTPRCRVLSVARRTRSIAQSGCGDAPDPGSYRACTRDRILHCFESVLVETVVILSSCVAGRIQTALLSSSQDVPDSCPRRSPLAQATFSSTSRPAAIHQHSSPTYLASQEARSSRTQPASLRLLAGQRVVLMKLVWAGDGVPYPMIQGTQARLGMAVASSSASSPHQQDQPTTIRTAESLILSAPQLQRTDRGREVVD